MKEWFENKTVAVVGNAQSLKSKNYGKEIDSHDVVVRINRGISASDMHTNSFGKKTNVWMFNLYNDKLKSFHSSLSIDNKYYKMQMNYDKNNRNFDYSYPKEYYLELFSYFDPKKPTTGIRCLHYISKCNPKSVDVYGFDWKETPTFYDRYANDSQHDYAKEKEYCINHFFSNGLFVLK